MPIVECWIFLFDNLVSVLAITTLFPSSPKLSFLSIQLYNYAYINSSSSSTVPSPPQASGCHGASIEFQTKFKLRLIWLATDKRCLRLAYHFLFHSYSLYTLLRLLLLSIQVSYMLYNIV